MQSCFLQTEKHRIGAIEGAESALGQPIAWPTVRFSACRESKLQLFFAAFIENAKDVSGIAQIEAWQWFDEWQDAMDARILGRNWPIIDQAKRHAVCTIGLTKTIIF